MDESGPDHNVRGLDVPVSITCFFLLIEARKFECVIKSYVLFSQGPCVAAACLDVCYVMEKVLRHCAA